MEDNILVSSANVKDGENSGATIPPPAKAGGPLVAVSVDEPMFWDNEAGWTTLGGATTFTDKERGSEIYTLPHVPDDCVGQ